MERMEEDNSWEGDPDDLELEAEIEAMNVHILPTDWLTKKINYRGVREGL